MTKLFRARSLAPNDNATTSKLDVSRFNVFKSGCKIKKIKIVTTDEDYNGHKNGCIELSYDDEKKPKEQFRIPQDSVLLEKITTLIFEKNGEHELAFSNYGKTALPAHNFSWLQVYTENTIKDYQRIHQQIHTQFKNIIEKLKNKEKKPFVEVIVLACGFGKEIPPLATYLEANGLNYAIYGFDIQEENIRQAKKKFGSLPNVHFSTGNAKNLYSLVKDIRQQFQTSLPSDETTETIVISSGFLTRLVNENTTEALQIVQQVPYISHNLIVSGRTDPLIIRQRYKKIGFEVENVNFYSDKERRVLYVLKTLSIDKIVSDLNIVQNSSVAYVDLSYKSRATAILEKLCQLSVKIQTINLSLCDIREENYPDLIKCIKTLGIESVHLTGKEPWLQNMANDLEHCVKVIQENEHSYLSQNGELSKYSRRFLDSMTRVSAQLETKQAQEIEELTQAFQQLTLK